MVSVAILAQRVRAELGERECVGRQPNTEFLHRRANTATDGTQISPPIVPRPHLDPVSHDRWPTDQARHGSRYHREVGKAASVNDIVAMAVSQQMKQRAKPETKGRQNPPPARRSIEIPPTVEGDQLDAWGAIRLLIGAPLDARQISDLVTRRQSLREVAIESLETSDSVRI